ncbi:unnamed protein product [Aureobasidium uvarum]|uniref:Uncharacterized protein n=1 Tax=Aureobasidium uvarum TaxID=2773716 RepID=A0A9N8KN57_9PEZI|nr:unnamed protein product [Aureobasidium uvarum]
MNWTGGKLQRNSKSKGNAVIERQKSHFAKARNKAPNRTGSSTRSWNYTSPTRPPPSPPFKKARTQHRLSPRVQKWPVSGHEHRLVGDFVLPSRNSDVYVRVGQRAFASQLDTTVASPSTRIRSHSTSPSDYSSNSMLLDGVERLGSQTKVSDNRESYRPDQGNSLTSSCMSERMRFALSDSMEDILRSQDDTQYPSDFATHASSAVHAVASPGNTPNNTSAEDMQRIPHAAERLKDSPVKLPKHLNISGNPAQDDTTSLSHEDFEDTDDTWLRFIEDEVDVGQVESDRYPAPQYQTQASPNALPTLTAVHDEPFFPVSVRGSTPQSSCSTARACLLETGTSKRIGGEISEKVPRLSHDDQVWMEFVLGYDPTDASRV